MSDVLLGPVDFVVVEYPGGRVTGAGLTTLLDLADADVVRVLDAEFLTHDADGTLVLLEAADLGDDPALLRLADAYTGLLDDEDLAVLAAGLAPGSSAAVVVVESSWTALLDADLQSHGAHLAAVGYVDLEDLRTALDG